MLVPARFLFNLENSIADHSLRAEEIFAEQLMEVHRRTDRLFVVLLILQWLAGIAAALWISPSTWEGTNSQVHVHVWAALFLGGGLSLFPVFLAWARPGTPLTRHVIAAAQVLWSGLFIHLTGGRIETHFHIFGSLAFLAFYRDWRILVTATFIVATDHLLRGIFWPFSVYGVLTASPWRTLEHGGWVVFENVFLVVSIHQGLRQMREIAGKRSRLEQGRELVEEKVRLRTEELRQAVDSLRLSEERFRTLVELCPYPILLQQDNTVVFINKAGIRLLGAATPAAVVGKSIFHIIHPDCHAAVRQRMNELKEPGKVVPFVEEKFVRLDGTAIDVEVAAVSLSYDGKPAVQVIAHDVAVRKSLEKQVQQSQKMEAIGVLAGGIAHDFNNLLTIISGYSEMLLATASANDPKSEFIREIHNAGARAATLTRQLLTFSRKQVIEPRVLDLNDVVEDMAKMLRRMIGEDISLALALSPDLRRIKVDPGQIEQVIMNLAVNARDAMPQGGALEIATRNIHLNGAYGALPLRAGHYVLLSVRDTGSGMDEQTKSRIFEPFFTTKEMGKGTGLGLATVYSIVQESQGAIEVESEKGRGATFRVYLPHALESVVVHTPRPSYQSGHPRGSETILLVEDEAAVRSLAHMTLQGQGYQVLEASTGEEALLIYDRHEGPVHLLLTDVVMPGMSGRHLSDHLAAARAEMKVLYMSGYTDDAIVRHGVMDAGMAFLAKPFAPQSLLRKVREVLDSEMPNGFASAVARVQSSPHPPCAEIGTRNVPSTLSFALQSSPAETSTPPASSPRR